MSKMSPTSSKGARRQAWEHEFDLVGEEGRARIYRRLRVHSTALLRSGARATPATTSVSGAPRQARQAAGGCEALLPVLSAVDMALTRHAMHRLRNRGITMEQVMAVSLFGKEQRTCGGATKHFLDKRSRQLLSEELPHDAIRALGRRDIVAVVGDGALITVAHRTRRTRND